MQVVRVFLCNQECFDTHINKGMCEKQKYCRKCQVRIYGKKRIAKPQCGMNECPNCHFYFPSTKDGLRNHECYVRPSQAKPILQGCWIWDKESCLDYKKEVRKMKNKEGKEVDVVEAGEEKKKEKGREYDVSKWKQQEAAEEKNKAKDKENQQDEADEVKNISKGKEKQQEEQK